MTAGIVAVVGILVGLPLAAVWIGGRRFWGRLRSRALPGDRQGSIYRDVVLRHHLRPAEIARVESAVTWGRRLDEPRLRAAVVDWAQRLRDEGERSRVAHPGRQRLLRVLLVLWLVTLVVALVLGGADGDRGFLLRTLAYALLFAVLGFFGVRGPRRAIALNRDEPENSAGALGEQPR